MMLSLDTAYRSFGGEVEASSTPTICRLPDSRRHQLSAIAPRPLGKVAVAVLRDWLERNTHPKLVFPGARGDRPADLKKAIANIFDAAGLQDARSHALRRTFASIGDEIGFSEATIGEILGHTRRGVTNRHYIRRPDAALVAAATRISDRV